MFDRYFSGLNRNDWMDMNADMSHRPPTSVPAPWASSPESVPSPAAAPMPVHPCLVPPPPPPLLAPSSAAAAAAAPPGITSEQSAALDTIRTCALALQQSQHPMLAKAGSEMSAAVGQFGPARAAPMPQSPTAQLAALEASIDANVKKLQYLAPEIAKTEENLHRMRVSYSTLSETTAVMKSQRTDMMLQFSQVFLANAQPSPMPVPRARVQGGQFPASSGSLPASQPSVSPPMPSTTPVDMSGNAGEAAYQMLMTRAVATFNDMATASASAPQRPQISPTQPFFPFSQQVDPRHEPPGSLLPGLAMPPAALIASPTKDLPMTAPEKMRTPPSVPVNAPKRNRPRGEESDFPVAEPLTALQTTLQMALGANTNELDQAQQQAAVILLPDNSPRASLHEPPDTVKYSENGSELGKDPSAPLGEHPPPNPSS